MAAGLGGESRGGGEGGVRIKGGEEGPLGGRGCGEGAGGAGGDC